MYKLIPYQKDYAADIAVLSHLAIRNIADDQYSVEETSAWSFAPRSSYHWHKRLSQSKTWLMIDERIEYAGKPVCCGFINIETGFASKGYIDSLYVHPDYQGQGIAKRLYLAIEEWALAQGYPSLLVDASKLSKPLFESQGFKLRHRSYQEKRAVIIMGYYMEKTLSQS
ncbi:N-acetyltransferase [Shewanella sairae]|uniref:N-acetyltransferase n=2 Tax=Shewanella sairae TaxID=190310 RepID=A0ABQ4PEW4_9GAMM|nr:GNAT family N-acetyltransferase [Shewanella sairae]MCL1129317.1 GNAT family N-acetyltransferase [Shewanella sairae]GIU46117.1 N-acetyltransferase [Shewanella sairae]